MMHAHSAGWIHRDASPDNILRLANRHWVLSDFGIAHPRAPRAQRAETGPLAGTPDFTAPEVRDDPSEVTPAADAWSLGALARWFTAIQKAHWPTSEGGRFWWTLIDGTIRLDPASRWTLPQIAAYLNRAPTTLGGSYAAQQQSRAAEQCPRCRAHSDFNPVGRCRFCGYLGED